MVARTDAVSQVVLQLHLSGGFKLFSTQLENAHTLITILSSSIGINLARQLDYADFNSENSSSIFSNLLVESVFIRFVDCNQLPFSCDETRKLQPKRLARIGGRRRRRFWRLFFVDNMLSLYSLTSLGTSLTLGTSRLTARHVTSGSCHSSHQ